MRKIYLVRHCQPDRTGASKCISETDESLNIVGKEQALSLLKWFNEHPVEDIYSSPLKRCMETAEYMSEWKKVEADPELREVSVGDWEGLTFEEIKKRWPKEYEERGKHLGTVAPPSGESFIQAGIRLDRALRRILLESQDDIAIVTHGGIVRGWLCQLLNISPDDIFSIVVPFGSITEIHWNDDNFKVHQVGMKPSQIPGPAEIGALFEKYKTPMEVKLHGQAVAKKALGLANDKNVDKDLLYIACLLHDFCRHDGRIHPNKAAEILENAGYKVLADIIVQHHDLAKDATPEAELLYLADKLVKGTESIRLEERFGASYKKCKDAAALKAWQKRYDDARRLMIKYGGIRL